MGNNYKKQEIRELYNIIYNNRIKQGIRADEAKRIALDAASLRFVITNDRVRHILYDKNSNNPSFRTFIYMNNCSIVESLKELLDSYCKTMEIWVESMNSSPDEQAREVFYNNIVQMQKKIDKYQELISIIEEVNAHYINQKR